MEENKKTPPIPLLKGDSGKAPFKFQLLNKGASLLERFKQFKKKDMAFIMAGLGVLFMAPLAEHFLMSPDAQDSGAFKEGWGFRDGAGSFGKGDSPYERGVNGMAPGSLAGSGSDVITPLNVRDPSALVMGPAAAQQPPASGSGAGGAPEKETKSDWKDALANAAKESTKRASLPVPKVALGQSGLRGLGASPGGSGASFTLPPISASNVPNRGGGSPSGLANVRPTQGYKGAAGARGLSNPSGGSIEALKKAARDAGADFNRNGPASAALDAAAARQMPSGGAEGGMGPGGGGADKAGAQGQDKGSKSTGESLEFLRMKQEQEKAIELKWKLIEKSAMRWPNLYDKMLESLVIKGFSDPISKAIADMVESIGGGGGTLVCDYVSNGKPTGKRFVGPVGSVGPCKSAAHGGKDGSKGYCLNEIGELVRVENKRDVVAINCAPADSSAGPGQSRDGRSINEIGGTIGEGAKKAKENGGNGLTLNKICEQLQPSYKPNEAKEADQAVVAARNQLYAAAQTLAVAEQAMDSRYNFLSACGNAKSIDSVPMDTRQEEIKRKLTDATLEMGNAVGSSRLATTIVKPVLDPNADGIVDSLTNAVDGRDYKAQLKGYQAKVNALKDQQDIDKSLQAAVKALATARDEHLKNIGTKLDEARSLLGKIVSTRNEGIQKLNVNLDKMDPAWTKFLKEHQTQMTLNDAAYLNEAAEKTNKKIGESGYYSKAFTVASSGVQDGGWLKEAVGQTEYSIQGQTQLAKQKPEGIPLRGEGFISQSNKIVGGIVSNGNLPSPVPPPQQEQVKPVLEAAKTEFVKIGGPQGQGRIIHQNMSSLSEGAGKQVETINDQLKLADGLDNASLK